MLPARPLLSLKRGAYLSLIFISPSCFAFAQQVLSQSAEQIELAVYVVIAAFALLFCFILLLKFGLYRAKNKISKQQTKLDYHQHYIDSFGEGTVHLDHKGAILFVNQAATYFLGKKREQILGKPFLSFFERGVSEQVDAAMQVQQKQKLAIFSGNRHLLVHVKAVKELDKNLATIITLTDNTNAQLKFDQQAERIAQLNSVIEQSKLGQFSLDLTNKTFEGDTVFAEILAKDLSQVQGQMAGLFTLLNKADHFNFNQALEQLTQQDNIQLDCRFETNDGPALLRLVGSVRQKNKKGGLELLHFTAQDLRELAKAKQSAHATEQLNKAVLASTRHAIYLLDDKARVLACNHAFERLFKTNITKISAQAIHSLDFYPESLKKLHPHEQGDFNVSRVGHEKEFVMNGLDGAERFYRLSLKFYTDDNGNRAGMVGYIEDLTELKQTLNLVTQERQFNAKLIEMSPLAIATLDANDKLIKANTKLTGDLGLSAKDIQKHSLYQLFDDPELSAKAAKKLHQQGHLHNFKALIKGKDNQILPRELTIDLIDETQEHYLCWLADNSAEYFQLQRFNDLVTHSHDPIAILGDKGFNHLNTAACELFMLEDEQALLGFTPYSEGLNKNTESVETLKQTVEKVFTGKQTKRLLWEHKVKDTLIPCELSLIPVIKHDTCDSVLCIWKDFRAVKEAERARLEAINLQQSAQREAAEKQKLLENSQDLLATQVKTLADTQTQLQAAQDDLSEKQSELSDLQLAHQKIANNLQQIQQDYQQSREKLAHSEQQNSDLEKQLESSHLKVNGLQEQRNQIANALQYSERKFATVQQELKQSEQNTAALLKEQSIQQQNHQEFVEQINALKANIEQKDKQINDVSGQISTLQSQLSSSDRSTEKLRTLLINQRKASEQAETQRRELEFTCHTAQSELSNKARHIAHLQQEMQKFEQMSHQQKDTMEQQQQALLNELAQKQGLLLETQQALDETQRASAQEKAEKEQHHLALQTLKTELAEMEKLTNQRQQEMAAENQHWQQQQQQLQAELIEKQRRLKEAEQTLNEAKQQTESEKQQKTQQQHIFSQLQQELHSLKEREAEQQRQMLDSETALQHQQQALIKEAQAKQQELANTQAKLDEKQRIADQEKRERIEQEHKLEQLTVELADVEKRAAKQRELMQGSDEQQRQFMAEFEQQKIQLQQALVEAEKQNEVMQQTLQDKLNALQQAETQVSQTQSGEQKLIQELNQARLQAETLQQRIMQQEQQEQTLQKQLQTQQATLQGREQNITELQAKQDKLTQELAAMQQEYSQSKQNLSVQNDSQSALAEQLAKLEQDLQQSQNQLHSKESALQQAHQQFEQSQAKLAEQELALVAAHKEELKLAKEEKPEEPNQPQPEFAKLALPERPDAWFALLPYLQKQTATAPLPVALNDLMQELERAVEEANEAMQNEALDKIKIAVKKLDTLAQRVSSEALIDQISRLQMHCEQGLVDNITIAWPSVKKSLMTTLRVIYSHLHA